MNVRFCKTWCQKSINSKATIKMANNVKPLYSVRVNLVVIKENVIVALSEAI